MHTWQGRAMHEVSVSGLMHNPAEALRQAKDAPVVVLNRDTLDALLIGLEPGGVLQAPGVREASLSQVQWGGVFAAEEVFAELDVLVVPSLWRENAPLIVLQVLASGLPMLLSDVEGMADQVRPGQNALLFPPGDSGLLASHLQQLSQHPDQLAQLVHRGGQPRSIAD